MKETKKCSLSGVAFTMDIDAFETLQDYLGSLKSAYKDTSEGTEIVADIEARIAELILSTQDNARVVEKPLVDNIIRQMGSPEDISDDYIETTPGGEPRIPRRLYRDTENGKLGGVCAGIGKYFDIDPVWVRLALFAPLALAIFGWIPPLYWIPPMAGNLFGIFITCYFIMWFAVPAARSARQKLEMNGEKITANSIRETTEAASNDPDRRAKPIVAEAVSVFGKVILILLKIFAGLLVFGLIMGASALIIGLFALTVGGNDLLSMNFLQQMSVWVPVLGIFVALIPLILLIYVLMCLIASRKPGGKAVLAIFMLWLVSIIACACLAIRENIGNKIRETRSHSIEQMFDTQVIIGSDTTDLRTLVNRSDSLTDNSSILSGDRTFYANIPEENLELMIKKDRATLTTIDDEGKKVSISINRTQNVDSVKTQSGQTIILKR